MRVCFVCLGNICRSPTAHGIFAALVAEAGLDQDIHVESAGTGDWHAGQLPDPRARAVAKCRGVSLGSRARQFRRDDFDRYDVVVAMDRSNKAALYALARSAVDRGKVRLLREFDSEARGELDVPDPFFGEVGGFEEVYDICARACRALLAVLRKQTFTEE
jgi:protein-tyrosine phosphatase